MTKTIIVRARDVMEQRHIEMSGLSTVVEAIEMLRGKNADVIIVEKRNADDVYGMVLLADIATRVLAKDRSPGRVNLYEVMIKPVVSVPPCMDIRYCARLFDRLDLSHAPVIENEVVVGILNYDQMVLQGMQV
ncbi:MAG: CBS domain-containing protein [Pseudomonadales bacterium]|nr:CBS domain-containing protein [Pseudomonadales bacterium]